MNTFRRLSPLAQAAWLRWLLVAALVTLHAGWIGYVIIHDKPVDFNLYYLAAYGFAHGYDVYGGAPWAQLAQETRITNYAPPYRYPPLTAELVWPLTVLPPRWAAFIWLAATAFSFVVSAWLLGCTSKSPFGVPLALGLFLFCVPILTTLHAGQANGFVLLALAFALFALTRQRPIWTGIGIAVGAMIKLIPVAHLAYLGWRRQWQAALTGLITILLLFGLAIPLIGWSGLASYAHNFLSLGSAGELIASGANQSFNGFFARLFVSDDGRWYLANAPQLARGLWLGAALVLALATAVLCWPITGNLQLFALEFALVTSAISLLTPYVWYHHLVLLLIPFFVLTERALARPSLQWMLIPLAIGYMATDIHGLVWHYLEPWPLLASMPFYTTLMLWGMLAGLIAKEKRQLMARDLPGKTVGEARRA